MNVASAFLRSLTSIDDAFARIVSPVEPITDEERLPAVASAGRVTARNIVTNAALPRFDHAAMDGFGLFAAALERLPPFDLPIGARIFAGGDTDTKVVPGSAVRLLTGAPVSPGVAAVVPEESCSVSGDTVRIRKIRPSGANIRRRGEDVPQGSIIVERGTRLDARHLAILAASGVSEVPVMRRVRVGLLSVGDELRRAGQALSPGQIPDANGPMLAALLASPSIEVVDLGLQRDDRAALAALLGAAASIVDVLVSSAGVSGSDADHMASAIGDAGGTVQTF